MKYNVGDLLVRPPSMSFVNGIQKQKNYLIINIERNDGYGHIVKITLKDFANDHISKQLSDHLDQEIKIGIYRYYPVKG